MRFNAFKLGVAASAITAVAFGICGIFFAIAPAPSAAFVSWVIHADVTGMTRPISLGNLMLGIVIFSAYVGALVGFTGALYNRLTTDQPRTV